MKIILGITSVLLLAVFSVAYLYFSNLTGDSRSNDKTLAAIPSDASMVFNFSNDQSLYEIFKDYTVFDALTGKKKKEQLSWLKSLLLNNRDFYNSTQGRRIFLSFHPMSSDSLQFLWVMPLKEDLELADIAEVIANQNGNQVKTITDSQQELIEIKNNVTNDSFYIGLIGRIARASFSKPLLLSSLDKNSKKISKEYINEINDALLKDDDALASLFINHGEPGFMQPIFKQKPNGNFGLFSSFPAYSNLNLNYKSDALMFNGITRITEKHDGYLNLFLNQQPVKNTIKKILPYNMSNAICYGITSYGDYSTDLKRLFGIRKELPGLDAQIQQITAETGINTERDIKKLWGNEFTNIQLSTFENLGVIRVSNGRQLQFYLDPLSTNYSDDIKKLNYENLFYYYFGDPLKKYSKPYYAITDNLIIISNSPGTVQRFLNDYRSDRLLYESEAFSHFDQLVADQSNISFILLSKNSNALFRNLLKKNYSRIIDSKDYGFRNFYGFSYQLTSNTKHFFTNFYLGYEEKAALSTDSLVYNEDNIP
ncbi:hypothetical protein [Daejeonella lutea]|nr:hypothetical protein [Daejeonella lutea]